MKNSGSTSTQNLKQIHAAVWEKSKKKRIHNDNNDDNERVIARVTLTHSLSVTKIYSQQFRQIIFLSVGLS